MLSGLLALGCLHSLPPFPTPSVQHGDAGVELPLVHVPGDKQRPYVLLETEELGTTLWFLDTGYTSTTCDRQWVEAQGWRHRRTATLVIGRRGVVGVRKTRLPELTVGDTQIGRLSCAVRDLQATSSIRDARVAGVLGTNVLRAWTVELNPADQVLRLHPPEVEVEGEPYRTWRSARRVRVRVRVGEEDSWPVLDTGASRSYLRARRHGVEPVDEVVVIRRGTGPDQPEEVTTLPLYRAEVEVAGAEPVDATFFDEERLRPGLVGMDLLDQRCVWIDYQRQQVALEDCPHGPLPVY